MTALPRERFPCSSLSLVCYGGMLMSPGLTSPHDLELLGRARRCRMAVALPALAEPAQEAAQPIEIEIDHRRRVERQQLRDEQAADDAVAERLTDLGAGAGAEHQRHTAQQSRHGGHEDRAET